MPYPAMDAALQEGNEDSPVVDDLGQSRSKSYEISQAEIPETGRVISQISGGSRNEARSANRRSTEHDASTISQEPRGPSSSVTKMPVFTAAEADEPAALSTAATAEATDPSGPSPYGTRSRNRNVSSRPNYAEDRENEMDYEWTSSKKSKAAADGAAVAQTLENEKNTPQSRRGAGSAMATKLSAAASATALQPPKDNIPGTSSFAVNGEANSGLPAQTRKRKAPGSGNTQPASAPQASFSTTRKASYHHAAAMSRDSNMVSFDDCGAYLQHGVLVADDKTRFSVNGELKARDSICRRLFFDSRDLY